MNSKAIDPMQSESKKHGLKRPLVAAVIYFTLSALIINPFFVACGVDVGINSLNQSSSESSALNKDASTPIQINSTTANPEKYLISGTCPAGANTVKIGEPFNTTATCIEGHYEVLVSVSNLPDGTSSVNITFDNGTVIVRTLVIDHIPPEVVLNSTNPGSTVILTERNINAYPISGSCTSTDGDVKITIGDLNLTAACTNNSFSTTVNLSSLVNGTYSVQVSQTDLGGNNTSRSFQVSKNTQGSTQFLVQTKNGNSAFQIFMSNSEYKLVGAFGRALGGMKITGTNNYKLVVVTEGDYK
jgi:hypothetical protein